MIATANEVDLLAVLPDAMRNHPAWIVWRDDGGVKLPINPRTGYKCNALDPAIWVSLPEAIKTFQSDGNLSGVGLVLTPGCGLVCVDIDEVANGDEISPDARHAGERLDTWGEYSVNDGLHYWTADTLPDGHASVGKLAGVDVEVYDKRFIAVTGRQIPGTPGVIESRRALLDEIIVKPKPPSTGVVKASDPLADRRTDDEIIAKLRTTNMGATLMAGGLMKYPSKSEAAAAMAFMLAKLTKDPEQIARILRQSKLRDDEKWDKSDSGSTHLYKRLVEPALEKVGDEQWKEKDVAAVGRVKLTNLADVESKEIQWLWEKRIARGKLTMVTGDPGKGKSTVMLDFASRGSNGSAWPDGSPCPNFSTVIISAEDDIADTLKPRCEKHFADCSKIAVLEGIVEERDNGGTIERFIDLSDITYIEEAVNAMPGCGLLVIDPVSACIGGKDSHKNDEIRALLRPLSAMAARLNIAVILVTHLNKAGGGRAIYRSMGSLAFMAAARAGYIIIEDPADPKRRMMLPVKNNIGDDITGFAYRIVDGVITWEAESLTTKADDILAAEANRPGPEPAKRTAAKDFLLELLANGPVEVKAIREQADNAGHTWATIRRASEEMPIGKEPSKATGCYEWRLLKVVAQ